MEGLGYSRVKRPPQSMFSATPLELLILKEQRLINGLEMKENREILSEVSPCIS